MQRRRARRWNRRLRVVGPFVAFVLLLLALALGVDLIEYEPQLETARLSTRPIPRAIREKGAALPGTAPTPGVSTTSVVGEGHVTDLTATHLTLGFDDDSGPDGRRRRAGDGPTVPR
jgi:hypothetical protein